MNHLSRRRNAKSYFLLFFRENKIFHVDSNKMSVLIFHYENTPIQIHRKFHLQKLKIFR